MTDNSRFDCETCGDLRSVPATLPCPACARVTGEQAQALATWIEGNVWQDSTVDVADLLRVLAVSNDQGRADQQQEGLTMPSEQPREGTRVNPDDVERAERWIGDAISRYYDHGCDDEADRDVMAMRRCIDALKARLEPAQPQPRGEGDDLAARLEEKSNVEEGLRPARPTNLPGPDLYHLGRAEAFAEAAQLARASTHPEQWGGSIRGCSPSSTRTPPTNAGRRGLAGSTDTNAPRGSCSNEPMPR